MVIAAASARLTPQSRAMISQRLAMMTSLGVRTALTLTTFALLARYLGPSQFGLFTTAIAYSTIAALATDFGFAMKALRDVGAEPDRAAELISPIIRAKAWLTIATSILAIVAISVLRFPLTEKAAVAAIYFATILMSYGDLMLITFRGIGLFARETRIVIVTAIIHGVIMVSAILLGANLAMIALAYLTSRFIYAVFAIVAVRRQIKLSLSLRTSPSAIRQMLQSAAPFAVDTALTVVYGQFDAVMVSSLVGLRAAGVYMAGARLVTGVLPLTSVLAGVQIPAISRGHASRDPHHSRRLLRGSAEFACVGVIVSVAMLVAGPLLVKHVYGPAYLAVDRLWPGFAFFTLARFVAAGFGAHLVAVDKIRGRIAGTAITVLATVALSYVLLPRLGVIAVPWLMGAGMVLLCFLYGRYLVPEWRQRP
jgi:O-antigen/teichoic acid export membrane protein